MTAPLPPELEPCREEMRSEECGGWHGDDPCGRKVTQRCPKCHAHRCASDECSPMGHFCPMCIFTDFPKYQMPEVH